METFTNPVVTSKAADEHYQNIVAQHSDIVQGLREQSQRVQQFNQNKAVQDSQDKALKAQQEKEQLASDQKAQELEIKRLALTS